MEFWVQYTKAVSVKKLKKNKDMEKDNNTQKILKILAKHIGTEPDEIKSEFSFKSDLHMNASDLSDFLGKVESSGFDTSKIDLTEIDTVDNLIEALE